MASFWIRSSIPAGPSNINRNQCPRHRDLENVEAQNHLLNTNEKTPLLRKHDISNYGSSSSSPSPLTPLLPPPTPSPPIPRTSHHRLRIRKLLLILLCISLLTPIYQIAKTLFSSFPCSPRPPSIPWRYYSRQYVYGLTPASTSDTYTLAVHESINTQDFPGGIKGSVKILTGTRFQSHNLLVYVQVFSTSPYSIPFITTSKTVTPYSSENITISSLPNINQGDTATTRPPPETFVNIYIYTRPEPVRLGHTSISTTSLDIILPASGARFETRLLSLSSISGRIANYFEYFPHGPTDPLYASDVSLSSLNNSITGTWSYALSFSAAAPAKEAEITLLPHKISWGPSTPADITIVSGKTLAVNMLFTKEALSLRNTSISITSYHGDIFATLVSGYYTNITALEGNIQSRLLPYWEHWSGSDEHDWYEKLTLETWSKENTSLVVEPPVNDGSMWYVNPLESTVAKHVAEKGGVLVKYPVDYWKGKVEVESDTRAEIVGVDGGSVPGAVREGDGKVWLEGKKEGSRAAVKGGNGAVFEFRTGEKRGVPL
ncbi:hypothetical protein TWF281_010722 [Arthrobotrys megalospora]